VRNRIGWVINELIGQLLYYIYIYFSLYTIFGFGSYIFSSPNIIRVIKSRIMGWEGHVARMGDRTGAYRV
jgi:hypothetical protein